MKKWEKEMIDMNKPPVQRYSDEEMLEKHRKHYDPNHPINFRRLSLALDGYIIEPQHRFTFNNVPMDKDGDYLHPVEVRCGKNPEDGIEIDFWNELTDEDSLVTLRIQFRKGNTCMGWICNWDGSLRLKPKKS